MKPTNPNAHTYVEDNDIKVSTRQKRIKVLMLTPIVEQWNKVIAHILSFLSATASPVSQRSGARQSSPSKTCKPGDVNISQEAAYKIMLIITCVEATRKNEMVSKPKSIGNTLKHRRLTLTTGATELPVVTPKICVRRS